MRERCNDSNRLQGWGGAAGVTVEGGSSFLLVRRTYTDRKDSVFFF